MPGDAGLAEALGVDPRTALRALGGGWRPAEVHGRAWPLDRWSDARWFVTGEPHQVLAGIDHAALVLARPVLRWEPQPVLGWTDEREFSRDDVVYQPDLIAETVEEIARQSRRRFRWCRTCHTVHAPGEMADRDDCLSCAAAYRGVVLHTRSA